MGLESLILFLIISVVGKDGSMGHRLHVNRHIPGVFVPKGRVIVLILRDNHNPDDIYKWHTCHAMYMGQNVLDLFKDLCGGGSVQGQGGILGFLVLRSPVVLILLLLL
jgi:hypothetical protein